MGHRIQRLILLGVASLVLLIALLELPWAAGPIGKGDFVGYWSASRLLLQRQNPFDDQALRDIQLRVYPDRGYLIYTWNPPWALIVLAPIALLPFQAAVQLWLLLNLGILAGCGGWLWQRISGTRSGRGVILSVFFPPTLAALGAGQIVPLVFLATIIVFEWQQSNKRLIGAGVALVVSLLKPQITFLAVAYRVWQSLLWRQWRLILSAAITVFLMLLCATLLFPAWPASYLSNITSRSLTEWRTPTLGGLLYVLWPIDGIRYLGLLSMLSVPWLTRRWTKTDSLTEFSRLALVGSVLAPFGWSFDQIFLLPAVLQMIFWRRQLRNTFWLDLGLASIYVIPFVMRVLVIEEFYFAWVPWLTLGLYIYVSRSIQQT